MAAPDEDDDAQVEQTDDEDREPGTEGDGAGGEDIAGRDEASDVSAQRTDEEGDEGAPPERGAPQLDAQQRGSRFQRLANENRELRERFERAERERENERQQWQRQQSQLNDQQERDRMALMTPEERAEYRVTKHQQHIDGQLQQMRMQTAMQVDKASFDAKVAINPVYRRMQAQVEAKFQEMLRNNQPTDRETILFYLLGQQAANGASSAKPRQQARRRVENQRVNPGSGKSDTERRASSSGKMSTAEERLKDVLI